MANQFPAFKKSTVPSSSRLNSSCYSQIARPLNIKAPFSFTSGTNYWVVRHHIQKKRVLNRINYYHITSQYYMLKHKIMIIF